MQISTQTAGQSGVPRPYRDRAATWTLSFLLVAAAVAWAWILGFAPRMAGTMEEMGAAHAGPSIMAAAMFLVAWGIMMVAMMLPSAAPMISAYAAIRQRSLGSASRGIPPVLFALMYIATWLAFGIPVYFAQLVLRRAAESHAGLELLAPYGVAGVLLLAGAFQLSPWKAACLSVCRTPLQFLIGRWREGYRGTLALALEHAAYCVGCCWLLMVILVAAGAMGLQWVLLIAAVVAIEKLLPYGDVGGRIVGAALMLVGGLVALVPEISDILRGRVM